MDRAQTLNASIIAVGDPRQLGAIEPGGLFAALVEDTDLHHTRLSTVWRMEAAWERQASLDLRVGLPEAIDVYAAHGRLRAETDLPDVLDDLADAYNDGQDVVVLARLNQDVDDLNNEMQARLVDRRDPGDELVLTWEADGGGERTIGVRDRIRTRRNDYQLMTNKRRSVLNGSVWTVTEIREDGLWVENTNDGGQVLLPNTYLEEPLQASGRPPVELAYAATLHAAQGATVDKALYVVRGGEGAEAQYVGMSRGRHTNTAVALTRSRVSDPTIGEGATVEDLADTMRHAARSPTVSGVTLSDETAGRTSPDPTPEPEPAQQRESRSQDGPGPSL